MSRSRVTGTSAGRGRRVAAVLAVIAFVVGACNTAASPSAGASGGAAAPAAQFCQGVKLVFFPGGTAGGGFETVVYNGAKAAEAAFGPTVTYQWSDWDPNKMITQFNEAVATKPDGIAVMGHPGDDAFDPLIDDARSKGILVTAMNTELQNAEAKYGADGFGYVGAVLHDAGMALANEAIKRGGLKSGDRAFVWGLKSQPGRGERTQGILDGLDKAGLTVDYLEIDDATNKDPAAGVSDLHRVCIGAHGSEGDLHRPWQPDLDDPDVHEGRQARPGQHLCRRLRPLACDGPGRQGRLRQPRDRPAAVPAGLPRRRAALPHQEVRLQRPVREHRRRLRRQEQHRRDRAARDVSRSGSGRQAQQPADRAPESRQRLSGRPRQTSSRASSCAHISKSFGGVRVLRDVASRLFRRRGRRLAWRQRRRQVDADQDRHRGPSARRG